MNNIENTTPIDVLADRVWSGTHWHYPNIEKLIARITALEAQLTAALATVEKCKADAERYNTLRSHLYRQSTIDIGEAYIKFKVVGGCPDENEWDKAIDQIAAAAAKGGAAQ